MRSPEQNREIAIKAAELKTWQRRAEEKLLPYALAAEQAPNHLKAQVYQDLTDRISAKLAVRVKVDELVVSEDPSSLRLRHEGLKTAQQKEKEIETAIEARRSGTVYQEEFDTLNDLRFSIKYAHQEGLKLTTPNLDERSRDTEGDRQVLESFRGARRTARTAIAHNAAPITEKPEYHSIPRQTR